MRFQCKYIAPPRDQYFTDIFNSSQNNAFVVIINKSNIKLVIKYGTFSLVFLALFLLKYQLIKIRWYFKRNKDRNTRENMPYLITRLIFAMYRAPSFGTVEFRPANVPSQGAVSLVVMCYKAFTNTSTASDTLFLSANPIANIQSIQVEALVFKFILEYMPSIWIL